MTHILKMTQSTSMENLIEKRSPSNYENIELYSCMDPISGFYSCPKNNWDQTKKCDHQIHIDSVHNNHHPYACKYCNIASNKGNLKIHIDSVHNRIPYFCQYCDHTGSYKGSTSRCTIF